MVFPEIYFPSRKVILKGKEEEKKKYNPDSFVFLFPPSMEQFPIHAPIKTQERNTLTGSFSFTINTQSTDFL